MTRTLIQLLKENLYAFIDDYSNSKKNLIYSNENRIFNDIFSVINTIIEILKKNKLFQGSKLESEMISLIAIIEKIKNTPDSKTLIYSNNTTSNLKKEIEKKIRQIEIDYALLESTSRESQLSGGSDQSKKIILGSLVFYLNNGKIIKLEYGKDEQSKETISSYSDLIKKGLSGKAAGGLSILYAIASEARRFKKNKSFQMNFNDETFRKNISFFKANCSFIVDREEQEELKKTELKRKYSDQLSSIRKFFDIFCIKVDGEVGKKKEEFGENQAPIIYHIKIEV